MALRSQGYYGLGGSSKSANFGLAANMTLPVVQPKGEVEYSAPEFNTMPAESKKDGKKIKFSVDLDSEEQKTGGVVMRSNSARVGWRQRISGLFRRNSKLERYESTEVVVPVTELPTRTKDDSEVHERKARREKRKKRDTKSRSTAFEEFTDLPYLLNDNESTDFLKLAIRPKNAASDFGDMHVTLRRKTDGFGIHLSGGLPPISITYVQPGSEAESARIVVGDIVTEVNGHDCRRGVGISRIMELKSLIQQTTEHTDPTDDDGVWEKIKEKQVELESEDSEEGAITRIDSSTESEQEPAPREPEPPKPREPEPPKAREVIRSSTPKKSSKKKKSDLSPEPAPLAIPDASPVKTPADNDSSGLVTVGVIKKTRAKKRTKDRSVEASLTDQSASFQAEGLGSTQPSESLKKKKKKKSSREVADTAHHDNPKPVKTSLTDQSSSLHAEGLDNEQLSESLKKKKKKRVNGRADDIALPDDSKPKKKRKPKQEELNPSSPQEIGESRSVERPKKRRPKSRDGPDDTDEPRRSHSLRESELQKSPTAADEAVRSEGRKKKRRSREQENGFDSLPADTNDTPKRKQPDGHKKRATDDKAKGKRRKKRDEEQTRKSPSNSKPNAHEEADDLQYMDYDDELSVPITSEKRSPSYHDLDKEDRKMYREELRQASQSEHMTNGEVDIDPDVRVMKSGKVVGKRKTNDRPSIFGTDEGSAEGTDMGDQERKTSMDLAAVPRTSPSLGLEHGHEKLGVVSRSLSKRRPASDRKSLIGQTRVDPSERSNGAAKVDNAAADVNQPFQRPRRQSIVEYMESLQKSKYNSLTRPVASESPGTLVEESSNLTPDVAKRIFEKSADPSPPVVKRDTASLLMAFNKDSALSRNKTVDQPVKKLGLSSETSEPSWVAKAKNKAMNDNNRDNSGKSGDRELEFPTMAREQEVQVNMGTVQARLAMFQKFK